MKTTESRENLVGGRDADTNMQSHESLQAPKESNLTNVEKKFLLLAERGDCASTRRLLNEYKNQPEVLDINCVDPFNRSALISAIENENIELIKLLLEENVQVKDALLHAIKEEYVEAVEVLLEWEEKFHTPGQPYSWEAVDRTSSTFTPDITPLILAAHMNNYEILKILLDRGATLPSPHDVRCGCDECVVSSEMDSLRHSQSRINAYKALSSPSLISLSSRDPLRTAFELSWELRRLSRMENEFRDEYNVSEMRARCQTFATALLDHTRTSLELEVMLNYNAEGDHWEPGERHTLDRLKLAIRYKQKMFVAHPNVQQLLASIWYEGLPGFRRKNMLMQLVQVAKLSVMFPVYSTMYMLAPASAMGSFMKKPFVKFICHSSSYAFFLMLLGLSSQRAEFLLIEWFGTQWMKEILEGWKQRERGALPGLVESAVILYVISLIWNEIRSLWSDGLLAYINDLWNIVDFITNVFYLIWIGLRFTSCYIVQREYKRGMNPWYPREQWDPFDPMLLSEGAFAAGMIFSYMKLVHIFSVNPHLGPLQISLGRMIIDILKFFFIYTLVLFAFGCGMNQLLWYYAALERKRCFHLPGGLPDYDNEDKACTIWRRFSNMFETSQSLFWASFGLVDLMNFELTGIKSFTRFWAMLTFGSYSVINIIVLLNMLIAMMSNSYQIISEHSDKEWKFARSKLWMSYFEEGDTVPAPFNIIPTPKSMCTVLGCRGKNKQSLSMMNKTRQKAMERHETVMHLLVRRYVTTEQTKRDDYGVTEDDVMEIRQDISSLRYELIDILRRNGMQTPEVDRDAALAGKKGRVMERRLQKDFQIGFVEGLLKEVISQKEPRDVFSKIARAIGKRTSSSKGKKDWNAMVRSSTVVRDPIGSANEAKTRRSRQSLRRHIIASQSEALSSMDPEKLLEYNPKLSVVSPAARVAYAKFKMAKIKQEYEKREGSSNSFGSTNQRESPSPSIARPRPRGNTSSVAADQQSAVPAMLRSALNESSPPTSAPVPFESTNEILAPPGTSIKDFRSRTPIQEDSSEDDETTAEKQTKPDQELREDAKEQQESSGDSTEVAAEESPRSQADITVHVSAPRTPATTSKFPAPPAPGKWL